MAAVVFLPRGTGAGGRKKGTPLCEETRQRILLVRERLARSDAGVTDRIAGLCAATGNTLVMDIRTGKTVLTTRAAPKRKTPREVLWIDPPGPAPYQNGGTLSIPAPSVQSSVAPEPATASLLAFLALPWGVRRLRVARLRRI